MQCLLSAGVMGAQLLPNRMQQRPVSQQNVTSGIGVDDARLGVDQEHAGGDAIERVGKARDSAVFSLITLPMRTARRTCGTIRRIRRRASSSTRPSRSWRNTTNMAAVVADLSSTAFSESTIPCGRDHSL